MTDFVNETSNSDLNLLAKKLACILDEQKLNIVFAESCTAGLLSATLSQIPGISRYLCGSFVTYRNASKATWLGVRSEDLDDPEVGPVSATVALQMASGALQRTPEANLAVSITGHLGPDAPAELDGFAYSAIWFRDPLQASIIKLSLCNKPASTLTLRMARQLDAATQVLNYIVSQLSDLLND